MRDRAVSRPSESGSAYIIALLVLVILSLLGLGLALISQTELQIGANELTSHRALYGAEDGVNLALAQQLIKGQTSLEEGIEGGYKMLVVIPEPKMRADLTEIDPSTLPAGVSKFGQAIEVSPFVPVKQIVCDLCEGNEGRKTMYDTTYAVVSRSDRIVWNGGARFDLKPFIPSVSGSSEVNPDWDKVMTSPRSATKQIYAMKGVSPWPESRPPQNQEDLKKIQQNILGEAQ